MSEIPLHRVKQNGKIDIWDLGPSRPTAPDEPAMVDDKLKGSERVLAIQEYEDNLDAYRNAVRVYALLKREHQAWHAMNGGPVKIELWGVDAHTALQLERYRLDLPRGVKPGRAQIEAEEMAKAEGVELAAARERDPQFGRPQGIQP